MQISFKAIRALAAEQSYCFSAGPCGRFLDGPNFRLSKKMSDETLRDAVTGSSIGDICRYLGMDGVTVLLRDDGHPFPVGRHTTELFVYDEAGELIEVVTGPVLTAIVI